MLTPRFGKFLVYGSGDVRKHASPNHSRASLNLIVEPGLYMLLRFQKAGVRENYETGNQAFSMRLRFLTIRGAEIQRGRVNSGARVSGSDARKRGRSGAVSMITFAPWSVLTGHFSRMPI
jgi:hypothetical protein